MEREILYRFFENKTTIDEEKKIREWIDHSKYNYATFINERITYDATIFSRKHINVRKNNLIKKTIAIVAAIIALLFIVSIKLSLNDTNNYNTLLVPSGQRINLILNDNTNIWLNSNTKLKYPTNFSRKERIIYLDGEAYFDVSENKKKPFIVKTSTANIKVTGTIFNIQAYSEKGIFETSLFEGGIDIYKDDKLQVSLKPQQKVTLNNNKLFISQIVNNDAYMWRIGVISFTNKNFEEIIDSLEKHFDTKIKIENKNITNKTYTGKLRCTDGLDYALSILKESVNFSYKREDDTYIIY